MSVLQDPVGWANFFKSMYSAWQNRSVVKDSWDRLGKIYDLLHSFYGVGRQFLKVGESILSKLALSGVSVSCLTASGFWLLLSTGFNRMLQALQDVDSALNVSTSGTAQFLERANYYLPLDTLATCILLYIAVWSGVHTFLTFGKVFGVLTGVRSVFRKD